MMFDTRFFKVLDSVDSTNNYAMGQVHAGMATHGMAWFANEQTAGKGQRGKTWEMEKGKNIILSIVIEPSQIFKGQQFLLSACIALACHDFFSEYSVDETKIKWPNDIYWRDRKAGGILIENVIQGKNWKWAVVGIGININQVKFDEGIKNPVSLKQITGKDFSAIDLAKELHLKIMSRIEAINIESPEIILKLYNQNLYQINKPQKLKEENVILETVIKGVNNKGQLLTVDAIDRQFDFGEVEWVIGV